MNKQNIDSKTLLIILLCIASVMITAFTFLNIKGTYDTRTKIKEEQLLSNQYKNDLAVLNSIKEQEEDITGVLLQYKNKIPAEPYEDKIIEFINDVSADAELLGVTFADRVQNDIAVEMPIKINIKSNYFTMLKLLQDIVGAQRFFTLKNIDITSVDSSTVNYIINLSAYYILDNITE